jgi:hypothetical protein
MKILVIQNCKTEGIGLYEEYLKENGRGYYRRMITSAWTDNLTKENTMRITIILLLLFCVPAVLFGQGVKNTSYVTSTGEKVLRFEIVIPVSRAEAWNLFTTEEGWKKWSTPVVSMDFKVGGLISTNYDSSKVIGDPGTIRLPIINYLEKEMLTLKVELNEGFSEKLRQEDGNLQEIIQLFDAGKGKTKIISSMIGWGTGPDWDTSYAFFSKGNEWTSEQLLKLYYKSK